MKKYQVTNLSFIYIHMYMYTQTVGCVQKSKCYTIFFVFVAEGNPLQKPYLDSLYTIHWNRITGKRFTYLRYYIVMWYRYVTPQVWKSGWFLWVDKPYKHGSPIGIILFCVWGKTHSCDILNLTMWSTIDNAIVIQVSLNSHYR